ncbi:MAG: hypothetical protein Q9160_008593 [Pyrenula sp. 1 TL-2023]
MSARVSHSQHHSTSTTVSVDRRASWKSGDEKRFSNGLPSKGYLHLKDIVHDGTPNFNRDAPLHSQLERAENYISSSKRSVEFRRPDLAYKDFLRGFEVAVNYIPRHKDYAAFTQTNKSWDQRYRDLCKNVGNMEPMMEQIRQMIEEDNVKTGVAPKTSPVNGQTVSQRPPSLSESHSTPIANGSANSSTNGAYGSTLPRKESPRPVSHELPPSLIAGSPKARPAVRPKPANLQGGVVQGTNSDALSQRFAQLRKPSSDQGQEVQDFQIPMPEDFIRKESASQTMRAQADALSPTKPIGPRDMPESQNGPTRPPKVPLSPLVSSLPQAPAPTYSPAKTVAPHSFSQPPRSSLDLARADGSKKQYYYNQPISRPQSPYRSSNSNIVINSRGKSSEIPPEKGITAETLMSYKKRYNVLLIDVRPRAHFDEGHILSSSIMCIEPVSLKPGVSAQDLEDRLVVSPESEKNLFEKRDEFDLVVYYDKDTSSTDYLKGPPNTNRTPELRALYDTLYEFNAYRPLKDGRPPVLLIGGIDAWVELMGPQSLAISKTTDVRVLTKSRPGIKGNGKLQRPQRLSSANSVIEVRRRRLQQQRRLDPAEAQALVQKARTEEIDNTEYAEQDSDSEQLGVDEEPPSPFVPDYESFLRRFPDINGAPQSMVRPTYQPPAPPIIESIEHADHPAPPSRPAPAVPRPSYSGLADTHAPQAPLARQVSATRPPLYAGSSSLRNTKLHYCGLTNLSNTCYMNATLQCLSATWPLSRFFLTSNYRRYLQSDNVFGSESVLPQLFGSLLSNMWSADRKCYSPSGFAKFVMRKWGWSINDQQDPNEFLITFLDMLHEDLNIHHKHHNLAELTPEQERVRNQMPIPDASTIEWQRYDHKNRSFISSLFTSQQVSRVICNNCGYQSYLYETLTTVNLALPEVAQRKPSSTIDLGGCFRQYCSEEPISKKCEKCGSDNARRAYIFTRWPQFLVISFKRFAFEHSSRKLDTPVSFPFTSLNLDEFTYPYRRPDAAAASVVKPEASAPTDDEFPQLDMATTPPFTYDLYGIIRHRGATVNSGHYTCHVQDYGRGCWRNFDDSVTRDFDPGKMSADVWREMCRETYVLFYQRAPVR